MKSIKQSTHRLSLYLPRTILLLLFCSTTIHPTLVRPNHGTPGTPAICVMSIRPTKRPRSPSMICSFASSSPAPFTTCSWRKLSSNSDITPFISPVLSSRQCQSGKCTFSSVMRRNSWDFSSNVRWKLNCRVFLRRTTSFLLTFKRRCWSFLSLNKWAKFVGIAVKDEVGELSNSYKLEHCMGRHSLTHSINQSINRYFTSTDWSSSFGSARDFILFPMDQFNCSESLNRALNRGFAPREKAQKHKRKRKSSKRRVKKHEKSRLPLW